MDFVIANLKKGECYDKDNIKNRRYDVRYVRVPYERSDPQEFSGKKGNILFERRKNSDYQ